MPQSIMSRSLRMHSLAKPDCRKPEEALEQTMIAELSSREVTSMTRGELIRVVQVSPPPGELIRTEYLDDQTLQRLAHLARLSCVNRAS